jgi:hypothetical protein
VKKIELTADDRYSLLTKNGFCSKTDGVQGKWFVAGSAE